MSGIVEIIVNEEDAFGVTFHMRSRTTAPTLADLQKVVGGRVEPAFTLPSPDSKSRELTGYVNEEGLCIGLPLLLHLRRDNPEYPLSPVAGSMIITALDMDGETQLLTDSEMKFLSGQFSRLSGFGGAVLDLRWA